MRGDHAAMLWKVGQARRNARAFHLVKYDPAWRATILAEGPYILALLRDMRRGFCPLPR